MSSLFLQGLVFSGLVIGVLAFLAWWLYLSPMKQLGRKGQSVTAQNVGAIATSPRLSYTLALMVGIGALLTSFGGYWDLSEHVVTGIVPGGEDFLWPPHLMVYAGFLLTFFVALGGLFVLAIPNIRAGIRDPRRWVRQSPYVGALVLVAGYGLFSIPGDAIWHELYGIDLTAWSPPHVFLAVSAGSLLIFAAGLLSENRDGATSNEKLGARNTDLERFRRKGGQALGWLGRAISTSDWRSLTKLLFLAVALSEFLIIGTVEWEVGIVDGLVAQRPIWLYPTIIGVSAFFLSVLAQRIAPGPWSATTFALLYFGVRYAAATFADVLSGAPPRLTLVFIFGAVLLDLTWQWMTRFGFKPRDWQFNLAAAVGFMVGFSIVAQPTIAFHLLQFLPSFTVPNHLITAFLVFVLNAALYPVALGLGNWLQSSGNEDVDAPQEELDVVTVPVQG